MEESIKDIWNNIVRRTSEGKSCYSNVTVCEEWLDFKNFKSWYEKNYPHQIKEVKFHLDKDWLQQGFENKVYSPETCIFLPQSVNKFLTNIKTTNTSGFVGVREYNYGFNCRIKDFVSGKRIFKSFKTFDECVAYYKEYRYKNLYNIYLYLCKLKYIEESKLIKIIKDCIVAENLPDTYNILQGGRYNENN